MELIGFLLLGIAAGILSGLFGIGGGIIMVPTLIAFFGMDILNANATSLTAMLLPVGVFGVIAYYKAGLINIKDSLWIALGLFVGSYIGGEFAVNVSENLLAKLYSGFLIYIALSYFDAFAKLKQLRLKFFSKNKNQSHKNTNPQLTTNILKPYWAFILVGFAAGIFAGMFGKGGGIIIVPILISLFRYDGKMAVATSLAALQLPVGLPSVLIYAESGYLNITTAAIIAVGMVVGALIGSQMGIKLPAKAFKKYYAVFLLIVAIYMLVGYL
jgi:hypothetical protein